MGDNIKALLCKVGQMSISKGERQMEDGLLGVEDINVYRADMMIRAEALKKVLLQKYVNYYSRLIDSGEYDDLLPVIKKIHQEEEKDDDCKKSDYCFITFSPRELKMKPLEFIRLMERICKLSFIKKYLYVVEQRYNGIPNENYKEIGDGIHTHLLIEKGDYRLSHLKRDCARVFKNVICNIDYKNIKKIDLMKVQGYMIDLKKEEYKQEKQLYDKEFRKLHDLRDYYGDKFDE